MIFKNVLPKENRLVKEKDFQEIFKKGKGVKEGPLTFKWLHNNLKVIRFAFVVSRKVSKKAVVRNSIKRALREKTRLMLPLFKKGIEGVIIANPGAEKERKEKLKKDLIKIFEKIKAIENND